MKFWSLSLLLAISSSLLSIGSAGDCKQGEEELDFTFFLDEDSRMENGWTLACSTQSDAIWNVPMGMLQGNAASLIRSPSSSPYVQEQVCLPLDTTCHLTVEDLHGDGLKQPGYYYLVFGATTVAVSEEGEEFFEKNYCFGPNCPVEPQEIREQCEDVYLFFQTDNSPEQSSVEIECGGDDIIFTKSEFVTSQELVEFEECIPTTKCCTLTIEDSGFDGVDPSQGGNIFVEWSGHVVLQYDDSNPFEFKTLRRQFGSTCISEEEQQDDGEESIGEDTENNEENIFDAEEGLDEDGDQEEFEDEEKPDSEEGKDDSLKGESAPNTSADPIFGDSVEQTTKQNHTISSNAKIALLVVGSLLALVGMVICITALCAASHTTVAAARVKDVETFSGVSFDTESDEEESKAA